MFGSIAFIKECQTAISFQISKCLSWEQLETLPKSIDTIDKIRQFITLFLYHRNTFWLQR